MGSPAARLASALLSLLLAGCPRSPSTERRLIELQVSLSPVGLLDDGAAAKWLGERVGKEGFLRPAVGEAARGGGDFRLRVRGAVEDHEAAGEGLLRAHVEARLRRHEAPPGEGEIVQRAVAERRYRSGEPRDPIAVRRSHLERALGEVLGSALQVARYRHGTVDDLVAGLGEADLELRLEAISAAGARRERRVVPKLVALLRHDEPRLRDRAVGALGEIGDPQAVRPLTEVARFADLDDLPKVIEAVATIGGDEARAYLEFVASGHGSDEMRGLAGAALGRLGRGRPDGAP